MEDPGHNYGNVGDNDQAGHYGELPRLNLEDEFYCSDFSEAEDEEEPRPPTAASDCNPDPDEKEDEVSSELTDFDFDAACSDPSNEKTHEEIVDMLDKYCLDESKRTGSIGARLIEPTQKLDNCKRYRITPKTAPVGTTLKLKMVKQFPYQQMLTKPLFELADLTDQYEKMEKDMIKIYSGFPNTPYMDLSKVSKGDYAVLQSWKDEEEETEMSEACYYDNSPVFKRIKFRSGPQRLYGSPTDLYSVEYIDYFTKKLLDSDSDILILDKEFAALPPRVCAIEMEGFSNYKNYKYSSVRKFLQYDSDNYVFDGLLTAEVQSSGKVVVWSDRFPKERYPDGINGFIAKLILQSNLDIPQEPAGAENRPINWSLKALQFLELDHGERLQVGDELTMRISYHKWMPSNYFFMVPVDRQDKLQIIEEEFLKIKENDETTRNNMLERGLNHFNEYIEKTGHPGLSVLCFSKRLNNFARGVFIEKLPERRIELTTEEDKKAKFYTCREWIVYFMDFGIVETVDARNMLEPRYNLVEKPAVGCLACHKDLDSKEKIRKWWKKLKGEHSPLPVPEDQTKDDTFDKTRSITRRVKIVSISILKRFGEVPQVEWCDIKS